MNETNRCSSKMVGSACVIEVVGEVDMSWSQRIRELILAALEEHPVVLVELAEVSYIDSSGIAALVEGYQTAKSKGVRFGLLAVSAAVVAVLELARLDQVFPIYPDLAAVTG